MPQIAQEINFWSGIMKDHAEFQLMTLSSRESQAIMTSQNFKNLFTQIENDSQHLIETPNEEEAKNLARKILPILVDFMNYMKALLKRLLECNIQLNLTPTFVNHMINEAMESYRALNMLLQITPINNVSENLLLHTIWLPDAAGHAASIAADLDPTETILIKEADIFKDLFNNLFIKAHELDKMLPRANLDDGALRFLNEEVIELMNNFIGYLDKVKTLREKCKAMGIIDPLMPDHMMREEKYYLSHIMMYME